MKAIPIEIDWHPGLSIYASESFLKTVGDEYGWIGGIDNTGVLRCILPYTIIRKVFFRMVRFRVETILLEDNIAIEEEKEFLNSAVEYFRAIGVDMIIPATSNTIFRTYPDGADAAPYGSFIIDLTQTEESIWNNLHSKHRNVARNAINNGVEIKSGVEHADSAYKLICDTLKRSNLGFMKHKTFKRLITNLGENVKIYVALHQGSIQGCAIIPYSNYSAYVVYAGSILQPIAGAMNLLHWEAIRQFSEFGVKRYDFVGVRINPAKGSKQEGLMKFKKRFGGQLAQGCMWKYSFHPKKYFIYSMAVRFLRGGDIVDLECNKSETS